MKKMRHRVGPDPPNLKQTTPDVHRETTFAPAAFNLNRNSALCLPLVSDSRRIIWVHSNEINLQPDGVAELDMAFDIFPYLTVKQTAALAKRCSLHPDQVKVWFMLQRLRYGISWDYTDIQQVRRKVRPEQEKLQNRMKDKVGGEKRKRTQVDRSAGKKVAKVKEMQSRNKERMMAKNMRDNEQQSKTKQDKTVKNRKVDKVGKKNKRNIQQQWKKVKVTDMTRKKRVRHVDEGAVAKKAEANKRLMSVHQWPADKSFVVPDELLDVSPLLFPQPPHQAIKVPQESDNLTDNLCLMERGDVFSTTSNCHCVFEGKSEMESSSQEEIDVDLVDHSVTITDADKLKEFTEVTLLDNSDSADGSSTVTQQQDVVDPCTPQPQIRCTAKTQAQLNMLKVAFSHCQYPNCEEYSKLAMVIGIHRSVLVQWFADMRYYIKKSRPHWMSVEQYRKVLANIRNRQFSKTLAKRHKQSRDLEDGS